MKLEDIPGIRQQFQALHQEYGDKRDSCFAAAEEAGRITGKHRAVALRKIEADWSRFQNDHANRMEELQMKFFGDSLSAGRDPVDPIEVLAWIEHFLKAT